MERFFRVFNEQHFWVRPFDTLSELAEPIEEFRQRYNEDWLVERLRSQSPRQAHQTLLPLNRPLKNDRKIHQKSLPLPQ